MDSRLWRRVVASGEAAMNGPASHTHDMVRQARTSFYWAMRLLPLPRRQAMFAIYAYCRQLDDIADGSDAAQEKLARLQAWRAALDDMCAGRPQGPVAEALAEAVQRYGLDRRELEEIIFGMEMDARGEMVAPPLATLRLYCRRVAGAVGILALPVFGSAATQTAFATALGEALQFTNILRDLDEDALMGRLYLPCEFLEEAGIAAREPFDVLADPRLPEVCERMAGLAANRFAEARALAEAGPRIGLGPALAMMAVYQRLLRRLCRRGWLARRPTPRLGMLASMLIAIRHVALARS